MENKAVSVLNNAANIPNVKMSALLVFFGYLLSCFGASATRAVDQYCALVEKVPDGFLNVRVGPGVTYGVVARLRPYDLIDVSAETCKEELCDESQTWQLVESVPRLDHNKEPLVQGWVHARYIRQIECPNSDDGPFSAIAAGKRTWEIVARHNTVDDARKAAIEACNGYTDESDVCSSVTAGPNQDYFVAANCGGVPFTSVSRKNCYDAIVRVKREARRRGHRKCNIFRCEQGGGPWKHGRY